MSDASVINDSILTCTVPPSTTSPGPVKFGISFDGISSDITSNIYFVYSSPLKAKSLLYQFVPSLRKSPVYVLGDNFLENGVDIG